MRTFSIGSGQQLVLGAARLFDGESYSVQRYVSCGDCDVDDTLWTDYCPNGEIVKIDSYHNPVTISIPGTYRVKPDDTLNCDAIVCFDVVNVCCGG